MPMNAAIGRVEWPRLLALAVSQVRWRGWWAHLTERSPHVPTLRGMATNRISLLNLAEYLIRLWGPVPKPKKATALWPGRSDAC